MVVLAVFLSVISIVLDIILLRNKERVGAIVLLIGHIFMIVTTIVCCFLWKNYVVIYEILLSVYNGIFIGLNFILIILICQYD